MNSRVIIETSETEFSLYEQINLLHINVNST